MRSLLAHPTLDNKPEDLIGGGSLGAGGRPLKRRRGQETTATTGTPASKSCPPALDSQVIAVLTGDTFSVVWCMKKPPGLFLQRVHSGRGVRGWGSCLLEWSKCVHHEQLRPGNRDASVRAPICVKIHARRSVGCGRDTRGMREVGEPEAFRQRGTPCHRSTWELDGRILW